MQISSKKKKKLTHTVSAIWQPEHYLNKNNSKHGHEKVHRPQPYPKYYRQLRKSGSKRNSLPQGRAHQLIIQHQIVIPENIHRNNIIQTKQLIFRNIHVCTHTYAYNAINAKETMNFRENGEKGIGVFGGTRVKGEIL